LFSRVRGRFGYELADVDGRDDLAALHHRQEASDGFVARARCDIRSSLSQRGECCRLDYVPRTWGCSCRGSLGDASALLLRSHRDVVATDSITNTVLQAIALKQNADVLHEVISHGGEIALWSDADLAEWANIQSAIPPAVRKAVASRVWDYQGLA
jgi:hypothetical protein